jgi:hypothetical protein
LKKNNILDEYVSSIIMVELQAKKPEKNKRAANGAFY